ncbi:MAG: phosphoribosylanthranilate isomerase [Anaerolineales bacterium]
MSAVQTKICGLTNLDDTLAAVDSGADYLGFNFYAKSPRRIEADTCARIIAELARRGARVKTVGVFVNHSPAEVVALMDQCGLDLAQLHGDEQLEHLPALRGRAFIVLRGAPPPAATLQELARLGPGQPAFLVDAHAPGLYGGSGQLADWDATAALAARFPIFLAGGLTPDNVAAAVAQVNPWGVDVASGVEAAPGKKDAQKMRAFVENAGRRIKYEGH